MEILGIDIGGSGTKAAIVNTAKGCLVSDRERLETPAGGKIGELEEVVSRLIDCFSWRGPVGLGFPGVVQGGSIRTAANLGESMIGWEPSKFLRERCGGPAVALNDADAAALAEMRFGAGKDREGSIMLVTIGTGLGTALFVDGKLVPNTELGHARVKIEKKKSKKAEKFASDRVRKEKDLSWQEWAARFNLVLAEYGRLVNPDAFILGGGVSRKPERFMGYLRCERPVLVAALQNEAGIIGAALAAAPEEQSA